MGSPLAIAGLGATAIGGITGAAGAQTTAQAQQLNIQGQILSTIGKVYGFETQAQEYGYKAGIATYQQGVALVNKQIAEQNADYAREVGEVEAQQSGMKTHAEISSFMASRGASGVDVNTGSSADVKESMVELGNYDQTLIRANASKVAYGYEVEATQDEAQAGVYGMTSDLEKEQSKNAMTAAGIAQQAIPLEQQAMGVAAQAGTIGAVSSLAGATASVASKWIQGGQAGLLPMPSFG